MAKDNNNDKWFFSAIWDNISEFFAVQFTQGIKAITKTILTSVLDLRKYFTKIFAVAETWQWQQMLNMFLQSNWIDSETKKELLKLKDLEHPLDVIGYYYIFFILTKTHIDAFGYGVGADERRRINKLYHPEDAHHSEMLPAAFIQPDKIEQVKNMMRESGLRDEQIDLLFISQRRLYDENVIRDLFWRGVIDEAGVYKRMKELAYTEDRITEIIKTWPIIPGAGDLFHMVAKEAFEPYFIEHYGYAEEFPEDQIQWLEKQGLSREWALRYWYAHWETPSIGQGYEMLHRGVIDWPELQDLFKTVEIPPFWRDKLTEIAYMPYTRVDVRRMHDIGVLSDEDLVTAYQDVGYSPEKALVMTEFTKQYNKGAEKDLTRAQITTGYKDGLLSKEDTQILLIELGYSQAETDYFIAVEDFNKDKELETIILNNIQHKFQKNLISESDCRAQLSKIDIEGVRIDALVEKWKIDVVKNITLPTKADLDKLLKAKIIDEDTYILQMRKLGFEDRYIQWYMKLIYMK